MPGPEGSVYEGGLFEVSLLFLSLASRRRRSSLLSSPFRPVELIRSSPPSFLCSQIDIHLPTDYPFSAPKLQFKTRIYHCNIVRSSSLSLRTSLAHSVSSLDPPRLLRNQTLTFSLSLSLAVRQRWNLPRHPQEQLVPSSLHPQSHPLPLIALDRSQSWSV